MTDARESAIKAVIFEALRFAVWAVGEGIYPAEEGSVTAPEDFFMAYSNTTGDEDWETLPSRLTALGYVFLSPDDEDALEKIAFGDISGVWQEKFEAAQDISRDILRNLKGGSNA